MSNTKPNATSAPETTAPVITAAEFAALTNRLDQLEGEVREYRALAEGRADELATLRAENDEIRKTLAGSSEDGFATKAEVERVRTDLEAVRKDRAETNVQLTADDGELSQSATGFESGFLQHIIETYYSSELYRFRRAVEADKAASKSRR